MRRKTRTDEMFMGLVSIFSEAGMLGEYNKDNYSIMLYDIPNNAFVIKKITDALDSVVKDRYKLIILSPKEEYTNIKILDIDL